MARGFWPLEELDILDIGCGGGGQLARLLSLGANPARLLGIDLLPERVDQAPAGLPELDIRIAAARTFSLGPDSLDLIWLQTVFSAIRDDEILFALIDRIREMLRPGGGVVWYDFFLADPRNPHTRPMRKPDIERYFRGFSIELARILSSPSGAPSRRHHRRLVPRASQGAVSLQPLFGPAQETLSWTGAHKAP
jgi:SAM-dependent methyltransferase